MDLMQTLDFYCERTGPEFWSEPFNAFSNLAFIMASAFGFYRWWSLKTKWLFSLSLLAFTVGVGSFLFHTYATRWAHLADILPIAVFMGAFLVFTQKEVLKLSTSKTIIYTTLFIIGGAIIESFQPRHILNGSIGYTHAVVALLILSVVMKKQKNELSGHYQFALIIFLASLFFRTIDNYLCHLLPTGTHGVWHLLNAALICQLLMIVYQKQKGMPKHANLKI